MKYQERLNPVSRLGFLFHRYFEMLWFSVRSFRFPVEGHVTVLLCVFSLTTAGKSQCGPSSLWWAQGHFCAIHLICLVTGLSTLLQCDKPDWLCCFLVQTQRMWEWAEHQQFASLQRVPLWAPWEHDRGCCRGASCAQQPVLLWQCTSIICAVLQPGAEKCCHILWSLWFVSLV